ncbi:MAG: aspartate aminotransferase family protein [Nitrosomonadaceae bacterium]
MTPKEHELMTNFLKLLMNYLQSNALENNVLVDHQDYESLEKNFDASIGKKGVVEDELLSSVQTYMQYCVRTFHPQFWGTLRAGYNIASLVGEILADITNTSMSTYEGSPVATLIENKLIKKMTDLVGFSDGDGIFVSGGTQANLVAVLSARNTLDPNIKITGLRQQHDLVLFISDQAHYSFISAANVLGLGVQNIIRVKTDQLGRMDSEALELAIQTATKENKIPFFIGATAGTTVLGAFDSIEDIASIASKYNLWLHVDGAFGGSALLSNRYNSLLAGSELADSFSWDAHKMMGVPVPCSVILMRKSGVLYDACTTTDVEETPSYVYHNIGSESFDLGEKSLQGTRKADVLKLWFAWKYYGDEGYENRLNHVVELAQYAEQKIMMTPYLEMAFPRQFVNLCFRYKPKAGENADQLNMRVQKQLMQKGQAYINYTRVKGLTVLMLNVVNPLVDEEDIDYLLNCVIEIGQEQDELAIF